LKKGKKGSLTSIKILKFRLGGSQIILESSKKVPLLPLQVVEVDVKVEEPGKNNVHNNAFYAEERLLKSELEAMRDCNPLSARHWIVSSFHSQEESKQKIQIFSWQIFAPVSATVVIVLRGQQIIFFSVYNAYATYVCKIPKCLRVHNLFLLPSECSIRAFQVHISFQLMSYSVFCSCISQSEIIYLLRKKYYLTYLPSVAHLNFLF